MGVDDLKNRPIKTLLLAAYCGTSCVVLTIVLVVSLVAIFTLKQRVLAESEDALRDQVFANSGFLLTEGGEVFEAKLYNGFQALVFPAAYSVGDVYRRGDAYSVRPGTSYADTSHKHLKQEHLRHTENYRCVATESASDQDRRGCMDGMRAYSRDSSSCYLENFPYNSDWVSYTGPPSVSDDELALNVDLPIDQDGVRASAVIDHFVRAPFENSTGWTGAYVALSNAQPTRRVNRGLFRQFPGFVQDLSNNGFERTYDPDSRSWYTSHKTDSYRPMSRQTVGQHQEQITEPFLDAFGNGYLITLSATLPTESGFIGVAGTDILVRPLQSLVADVKFRQTGSMHMYHNGPDKLVAASPQWSADDDGGLMRADEIALDAGGSAKLPDSACSGEDEVASHLVIRRPALNGEYCLAAIVKVSEVVAPIEEQKDDIEATANGLMGMIALIIMLCFFVLVMPCTVLLSLQLSKPLVKTSEQSRIIARNIGGDLLKDVWIDSSGWKTEDTASRMIRAGEEERKRCLDGGIGEVTQLRAGFINVLAQLQLKRDTPPTAAYNPLFTKVLHDSTSNDTDPNAPSSVASSMVEDKIGKVSLQYCDPALIRKNTLMEMPELTCISHISTRLKLQLVLPLVLALLLIIIVTSTLMFTKANEWIQPVKQMMLEEELTTMDIRARQREELVAETLGASVKTLLMIQAYATALYSDDEKQLDLASGYDTPFEGNYCVWGGCDNLFVSLSDDESKSLDTDGGSTRRVNLDHSGWYAPQSAAAPSHRRHPGTVENVGTPVQDQQKFGRASHLDNVARVAYFSSDVTDVYFGWEHNEAYRIYPNRELTSWYWNTINYADFGSNCGRVAQGFTPLCRAWYSDAVAAQGGVVFGQVAEDPDNGQPFVPVSAAFYRNGNAPNNLVGVAAISIGLRKLDQVLRDTKLYENGYAYIFDFNGFALLHPDWSTDMGPTKVSKLASGGDSEFGDAYQAGVVDKFGQEGRWEGAWKNPETGEKEVWYYSFRPITHTPYQLVLGVSEHEVELSAQTLQESLEAIATFQCVLTSLLMVLAAVVLVYVSYLFQRRFVVPVQSLRDVVVKAEKEGYRTDVDMSQDTLSLELKTLNKNFTKLLTALRFNNPDYHKGSKALELMNLREAETIVNESGNFRGIGVCKNNLGNIVRGMSKSDREKLPPSERDPRVLLQAAVKNAEQLSADPTADVSRDTVGSRLLGLALTRLDYGEEKQAVEDLRAALGIHKASGNWQALARLGFVLVQQMEAGKAKDKKAADGAALAMQTVDKLAEEAAMEAAALLKAQSSGGCVLPVNDGAPLAQLCYCLSVFHNNNNYSMWALNTITNLDSPLVSRLGQQVLHEPNLGSEAAQIIQISKRNSVIKKKKLICFCIDRTWNPILEVCIKSIKTIIRDHVGEDDTVCMWGLGTGWVITDTRRGDGFALQNIVQAAQQVTGRCQLYRGMLDTCDHLTRRGADMDCWLVVLTDLVDLEGKNPKFRYSAVREKVKGMPGGSTLAVIDTSQISGWEPADSRWPTFKSNMRDFVDQAVAAGHGGHLLVATDLDALAAKFQEVGELMAEADLGEHL